MRKKKLQWGITSHWWEWPSSKNLQTVDAGEDMEKREPSYTVNGIDTGTVENSMEVPLKTKNGAAIWPSSHIPGFITQGKP